MDPEITNLEQWFKFLAWFDKNKKQIKMGVIGVAVLGLLIAAVVWQRAESERKAGEALSDVFVSQLMSPPGARSSGVEAYQKVALTHQGHEAGAQAMLLAATGLFTDSKYKDALGEFDRFLREHPDSQFVGQVLLGRAACYDALNQTNDAATAYKTLIDQHPSESMIPQAKFSLARIYEAQGKIEQARNLYEDVGNNRYTSIGSEAGIRLEELLQKHPELVPTPPAVTPMPATTPGTPALLSSNRPAPTPAPTPTGVKPAAAPVVPPATSAPAAEK